MSQQLRIALTLAAALLTPVCQCGATESNGQADQPLPSVKPRVRLQHNDGLFAVALTPDGKLLATGDENSAIHLWDVTSGKSLKVLTGHEGDVVDLDIDRGGSRLASAGHDGIRLWQLPSGAFERQLATKRGSTIWIRFAPDGHTLATGGSASDPIQIWDVASGQELPSLPSDSNGSRCAAFSPDGRKLAASYSINVNRGEIRIWDIATRQESSRFSAHDGEVRKIAFTPDGIGMITADISGEVVIWNSKSGGPLSIRLPDHNGEITALAVSHDGSILSMAGRAEQTARCWELATGKELSRLEGHKAVIKSIALSADGTFAVSAGFDGAALVWPTIPNLDVPQANPSRNPVTLGDAENEWDRLAGDDALAARQAIKRLRRHPTIAIPLAQTRIRPLDSSQHKRIATAIDSLNDKDVAARHRASDELIQFGDLAEIAVRTARANHFALTFRQRLDVVLDAIQKQPVSTTKRMNLRGIQLLEQIGDAEAVKLLMELAQGAENDICTIAATSALDRLGQQPPKRESLNHQIEDRNHKTSFESIQGSQESSEVSNFHVDSDAIDLAAQIDRMIDEDCKATNSIQAPLADDFEWLRRVTLDLTGRIPLAYQIQDFIDDVASDKRQRLIDRLIESPQYIERQTDVWQTILMGPYRLDQPFTRSQTLRPAMERWLHASFKENQGYDQIVRSLLTTPFFDERLESKQRQSNEAGMNPLGFFFRQDSLSPEVLGGETSRVFLGVKLECAQCHDHPFADWKRQQFWEFAAFFSGVRASSPSQDLLVVLHGDDPEQATLKLPDGDVVVTTRFLNGDEPKRRSGVSTRELLAEWVTAPSNPYFARTAVNRVWAEFFGSGLVEPLDDLNLSTTSGRKELIDLIAGRFVQRKFDLKFLARTIALTKTYQRTSRLTHDSQREESRLAKMTVRSLTGEQIHRSLIQASAYEKNTVPFNEERRQQWFGSMGRVDLVRRFSDSELRARTETSLIDALYLMNGPVVENLLRPRADETLSNVILDEQSNLASRIDALYLATLSRYPRPDETVQLLEFLERHKAADKLRSGWADVFWALLNSGEFLSNH